MEHSSFSREFLASMLEEDRVIALAEFDDCIFFKHGDLAILVGFWKAQALRSERDLAIINIEFQNFIDAQEKRAELDSKRKMIRDARDLINEQLVAYGAKLIKERSERIKALSKAGLIGVKAKNKDTDGLKSWAIEKAKKMHGTDKANAKSLFKLIPDELKDASKDPERLIYEALRVERKKTKLMRQASHT
jgi:hypothetical protein